MTAAADLLVTNGIVMTMDPKGSIIDNGAVASKNMTAIEIDDRCFDGAL